MSDQDRTQGNNVNISARDLRVGGNAVVGVDASTGGTKVQQNNQLNIFFERQTGGGWKRARQVLALVAGLALITTVLTVTLRTEKMSAPLYTFLRIMMALGGAAFAVCIDGFLQVKFKPWLRAAGGFAVFVIIYFFQVARPTSATPAPDEPASSPAAIKLPEAPAGK